MDGVETGAGGSVMNNNIYALYRGDEYIMDGTLQEIADARGTCCVSRAGMNRMVLRDNRTGRCRQ